MILTLRYRINSRIRSSVEHNQFKSIDASSDKGNTMKILTLFAFALVIAAEAQTGELPVKLPNKCLIDECGPPNGSFTNLCKSVCVASKLQTGGSCTYQNDGDGQRTQCNCNGDLGSEDLPIFNCSIFCGVACINCGFRDGRCTKPSETTVECKCN